MRKILFGLRLFIISIATWTALNGLPNDAAEAVKLVSAAVLVSLADTSNVARNTIRDNTE